MPWSTSEFKMAELDQFIHVPWNIEICQAGLGPGRRDDVIWLQLFKDFRYSVGGSTVPWSTSLYEKKYVCVCVCVCSVPSHNLNQCWLIFDWNHLNKLKWNLNQNTPIFIQENEFENSFAKWRPFCLSLNESTHCGLVTPFAVIEHGLHWFKQ